MRLVAALAVVCLVACASSAPGGDPDAPPPTPVDAPPIDAVTVDALPAPLPDAEPCIPDPDGETCDGQDDDCDGATDEGYPGVGEACSVGVGACVVSGTTVCTADGATTECDATPSAPTDELCGSTVDEDCDGAVDEGFPTWSTPCAIGTGACFATGVNVCSGDGLSVVCDATAGNPSLETCDNVDEDCDGFVDEGFHVNQPCDGPGDDDLCQEGVWACDGAGGAACTDLSGSTYDLCGGGDDDCDPTSGDGSEDGAVGLACDGADGDLCVEGVQQCVAGALVCNDTTSSSVDLCGGGDEDCDPGSPDGSEDPMLSSPCDGGDSDLCVEGVTVCAAGNLVCNDASSSTLDLCGNGDEDCDAASGDGSEDPQVGQTCDGGDGDLCLEGTKACVAGSLACSDATTSTPEVCAGDGADEDCSGTADDGIPWGGEWPSCSSGTYNVGTVRGDNGNDYVTRSHYNAEWHRLHISEDDNGIVYVSARIALWSPPGVDYDLYAYCFSCGGSLAASSASANLDGHWETVDIRVDDDWGQDDGHDVLIYVAYRNANRCAYWQLDITGNLSAPSQNCNP